MKINDILEGVKQRLDPKCWTGYHKAGTKMKGGVRVNNCVANENMDHKKDDQAVPELKAALTAQKKKLQSASDNEAYDIIDKMMTRIAKSHGISGQQLHDMWVDKYKQIPDTWIMKEAANPAQQAAIAIAKKKKKGVEEASGVGYIPKNKKEANDPRYVMAMTQDIKPGEDSRQAAKWGFNVGAGGKVPKLRPDGRIGK